jgi:hypothetical protein
VAPGGMISLQYVDDTNLFVKEDIEMAKDLSGCLLVLSKCPKCALIIIKLICFL